jgi:predicted SprT family Zn-dependent metalloprotease
MKFIGIADKEFQAAVEAAHAEALPKLMGLNNAFVKNGHVHKMLEGLVVEICPRMRSVGGWAMTNFTRGTGTIRLNYRLLGRNTAADIRSVYIHELAHIVANLAHGRQMHHTKGWKRIAVALGDTGERCHRMDTTGLKRKVARDYLFACRCREYHFTSIRHRKHLKYKAETGKAYYRCRTCCQPIEKVVADLAPMTESAGRMEALPAAA